MGKDLSPGVLVDRARSALVDLARRDFTGLTDAEIEAHAVATAKLVRLADAASVAAIAQARHLRGVGAVSGLALPPTTSAGRVICRSLGPRRFGAAAASSRPPVASEAFAGGQLTVDHVRLLAHAQHKAPDAFVADEPRLVESPVPICSLSSRRSSGTGSTGTIPTVRKAMPPARRRGEAGGLLSDLRGHRRCSTRCSTR